MKPHVAFLSSPGMGHITPLLELAKRLALHHGFKVTFLVITTTTESSAVQDQLLRFPTLPPHLHIHNLPPVQLSTIVTPDMPDLTRLCTTVRHSLKSLRSTLLQLGRPKALVIDIFATEAFDVCKDLSIPVYSFFTASTALLTFSLYLPKLDDEVEGEFVHLPEPVRVPGCKSICTEDLLEQVRNRKIDDYKWYLFHASRLPMAEGIFVNTWIDLEPDRLRALNHEQFFRDIPIPPVHPVGPLIRRDEPVAGNTDAVAVLKWMDDQPCNSVLLVALGSGGTLTTEQLTELAWGLEMSQQRFVLVARKPNEASASAAFYDTGRDVNEPSSYLPEGFMKRTKKFGLVVPSWVPQVAVLGHKSTAAFLSHCGWNSTLESVVNGVPMIAWPLYAEQRMNATVMAEDFGVAVKPAVAPGESIIRREEVERVVRLVMEGGEGEAIRRRARELQESARQALDCGGGSSHEALCRVTESWKSQQ
ncbi:hypothetical protein RJ640_021015 [Escallonia rubra]|uniref:Glycosyltransferase n=1 Tax=Escallonia rubra TaxID=112253 RepID=A0AA88UUZ4_9ASTE|nr:hypothetical protein RJ640_021015 [Escallonia rubra]